MIRILTTALTITGLLTFPAWAWSNGQRGNAQTDRANECASPPYSTHDYVAHKALMLLPENERAWLEPHLSLYLLGTEAPDNDDIPAACGAPNTGYDDRRSGHSITWTSDWTRMSNDRAAHRAQQEYDKAGRAYDQGDTADAAYYLGAMAHYIGDVSAYPHSIRDEKYHSEYEGMVSRRTPGLTGGAYDAYIQGDGLVRRRAYTAAKRISRSTARGDTNILPGLEMDARYSRRQGDSEYEDTVGHSLNLGANELADVLHTFYLNVVSE